MDTKKEKGLSCLWILILASIGILAVNYIVRDVSRAIKEIKDEGASTTKTVDEGDGSEFCSLKDVVCPGEEGYGE